MKTNNQATLSKNVTDMHLMITATQTTALLRGVRQGAAAARGAPKSWACTLHKHTRVITHIVKQSALLQNSAANDCFAVVTIAQQHHGQQLLPTGSEDQTACTSIWCTWVEVGGPCGRWRSNVLAVDEIACRASINAGVAAPIFANFRHKRRTYTDTDSGRRVWLVSDAWYVQIDGNSVEVLISRVRAEHAHPA